MSLFVLGLIYEVDNRTWRKMFGYNKGIIRGAVGNFT